MVVAMMMVGEGLGSVVADPRWRPSVREWYEEGGIGL